MMPIKIIKNRGINIKRQLLSIKLSINVNSKKGFVFAQKNAACCIKWARQKEIEDKIILVCILKQLGCFLYAKTKYDQRFLYIYVASAT